VADAISVAQMLQKVLKVTASVSCGSTWFQDGLIVNELSKQ